MPRKPRIEFSGAFYHVLSRGNNRQPIFLNPSDYKNFLACLKGTRERYLFILYAYVLMPNHFHLLLETIQTPLSRIMLSLLTKYVKLFNPLHKRIGHLFQSRYKAILCQKDAYLLELVRYLHLNPVRAGLVNLPSEWLWSSHAEYLGIKDSGLRLESGFVLEQFSKDLGQVRTSFTNFVAEGFGERHREDYYPTESFPFLGEKTFLEEVLPKTDELCRKVASFLVSLRLSLENLAKVIMRHLGISVQELVAPSRTKEIAEARALFAFVASRYARHRNSQIARFLNLSESAISREQQRFETKLLKEKRFQKIIQNVIQRKKKSI